MSRTVIRSVVLLALAVSAVATAQEPKTNEVPKGEVMKFTFEKSKVFPGTTRDVWVYVPKQYDPKTPACVYVNQDGVQWKAPEVFDRLIHAKKIPVTVACS